MIMRITLPRFCVVVFALLLGQVAAYSQTTLTGAIQFSTDSTGTVPTTPGQSAWNTVPVDGNCCYGLWLSLNPDATLPVNGPSNTQTPIALPLVAGNTYKYYMFAYPYMSFSFNGLNLFFDGNDSIPGISVFGATNSASFLPDGNSTLSLQALRAMGSGKGSYSADGVIVVLTGYDFHTPAAERGNVCQDYTFAPASGNVTDYFGSFTLQVFPAASLSLSESSGSPGTEVTVKGSGFSPEESVEIYLSTFGAPPVLTVTSDANGRVVFRTRQPQHAYGALEVFALGLSSHKLGEAALSVSPGMVVGPDSVKRGATTVAEGLGFGAGELVSVYIDEPRELLGTTTANSLGSFIGNSGLTVTIPSNATFGTNALIGIGKSTQAVGLGELIVK